MSSAYSTQVKALKQMDSSKKAHQEAYNESLAMYGELNDTLEIKVKTSHRIIDKLNGKVKSVEESMAGMRLSHQQLQAALKAKDAPLSLCAWRMEQREKRPLREHVRDKVEISLEDERQVLLDTQKKLNEAIKVSMKMSSLLEGKRDELRYDIEQKNQALSIDQVCLKTATMSLQSQINTPRSCTPRSSRSTTLPSATSSGLRSPGTARSTASHVGFAEGSRNEANRKQEAARLHKSAQGWEESAAMLRADSAKLIARCEKVALEAAAKTERALQERINEVQHMKRRLEAEIRETRKKEENTKHTISQTLSQISGLKEPMQLVSSQSSWRKQRACKEQIIDPVEMSLENQKISLMKTTEDLRYHRQVERGILTELQEHMERLTEDLKDKTAALEIDTKCLTHSSEIASPKLADPTARARYERVMRPQSARRGMAHR